MSPPRDGDGSSSEDGTLAQIIPLRRRTPESEKPSCQPPEASGVFDPPEEPEPLAEYSIWERPTAELIRREQPETPRSAAKIAGALREARSRRVPLTGAPSLSSRSDLSEVTPPASSSSPGSPRSAAVSRASMTTTSCW